MLTRIDAASPEALAEAQACLDCLRPGAIVLASANANLSAATLLDALEGRKQVSCGHDHSHAHHTPGLTTAFAPLEGLDAAALRRAVEAALASAPDALLRLKGLVLLSSGGWMLVQATPDALDITPAPPGARPPERSGVTIIAHRSPAADIAETLRGSA